MCSTSSTGGSAAKFPAHMASATTAVGTSTMSPLRHISKGSTQLSRSDAMHPVGYAVGNGTLGKTACRMICKCSLALDLKCHRSLVNSMWRKSALRNHMTRMPMFEAAWQTEAAIASKRLPDSVLLISISPKKIHASRSPSRPTSQRLPPSPPS